jgi:competence protein ComEC
LLSTQQPLLYAAIAFAAGILFAARMSHPASWWIAAALVLIFSAGLFLKRRQTMVLACGLLALSALGALTFQVRERPGTSAEVVQLSDGSEVVITGHVVRDGIIRSGKLGTNPARQSVDLQTEAISRDGKTIAVQAGVRLNLYYAAEKDDDLEAEGTREPTTPKQFTYGERLRVVTKLRQPRNFGNPGAFDYRQYLANQGIVALGSARSDEAELLDGFARTRAGQLRSRVRRSLLEKIDSTWQQADAALIAAMLLGDRTGIDRETTLNYQRTGTYHILVVSGLTVGVLAFPLLWLLLRCGVPELVATALTVAATAAYAYVTDGGAPVMRATLMLIFYLVLRLLNRGRAPLNAIGAAALAMLLIDPQALFDASFQLTFLAILAIAGIGVPVLERTSLPFGRALRHFDSRDYDLTLEPRLAQFRLDMRLIGEKLAPLLGKTAGRLMPLVGVRSVLAVYEVVVVSALIQIALALPMAVYFHRAVALGLPANTLIVPAQALLVPPAALALALSYLSASLATVPAMVAAGALHWTNAVVEWMARMQLWNAGLADLRVANPEFIWALLAAMAFAAAMVLVRKTRWLSFAGIAGLALTAAAVCLVPPHPQTRPGVLEVTAIDVGQGDSILVVTPEGRTLLIDAGGALGPVATDFDYGEEVVSTYLWSRGLTRLDAIALTHAHADHIGGLGSVMRNFRPQELWLGVNPETGALHSALATAHEQNIRLVHRTQGEAFRFGGAQFEILAPPEDWRLAQRPRNNDSLVMLVRHGANTVLLAGDAERRIERLLVEAGVPRVDLLKVGHHGSATSTSLELLNATTPSYAVISVGFRSPFGHPRPEVLKRLQSARVKTFRTDLMGATSFYLDGKQVTHETFVGERR